MWCHSFRITSVAEKRPVETPFAFSMAVLFSFTLSRGTPLTVNSTMVATVNARTTWALARTFDARMWVPLASFCKGAAQTGYLIAVFITRSSPTIFFLHFRKRVRNAFDHRRIVVVAGTVQVAHDHEGHTDHHRCDRNFFHPRNRSRWRFIRRSVGGRNGLIRSRHGILVWFIVCLWICCWLISFYDCFDVKKEKKGILTIRWTAVLLVPIA